MLNLQLSLRLLKEIIQGGGPVMSQISPSNSLPARLGGGRDGQGGAQQGTGARGAQLILDLNPVVNRLQVLHVAPI
jgi:hypothetical protein